jgi:stage II sporulation protein D
MTVVNDLDMEDYLRGVVPQEMSHTWPAEALKCQAVVARSYAAAHKGNSPKEGYDLCATAACQVYGGKAAERPASDAAVRATRGQVLTHKGQVISAVFHSCCGGETDDSADVWKGGRVPYLSGVRCRWCREDSPHYQWKADISDDKMSARLKAGGYPVGKVTSIRVVSRTGAGRAYEVRVGGDAGAVTLKANPFRLLVGDRVLKSTFWSGISHNGDGWRFSGRGWGHGVGLCQWCARSTADKGYKYKEILTYFYRRTKVKDLS